MFGVAEDHDFEPDQARPRRAEGARRQDRRRSIRCAPAIPRSPTSWSAITPGTDGLFVLALVHCLLASGQIDPTFLVALHQRALSRDRRAGRSPITGCSRATPKGKPLTWDRATDRVADAEAPRHRSCAARQPTGFADGRAARRPSLCSPSAILTPTMRRKQSPTAVASRPTTIRRIAAEIAEVAFNQPIVLDQPWTDTAGRRHETMLGRPVAMHAMRGISAHSNGFQTCRAIHVLQMLLGAVDTPGRPGATSRPIPKPIADEPAARRQDGGTRTAARRLRLGFPHGPGGSAGR